MRYRHQNSTYNWTYSGQTLILDSIWTAQYNIITIYSCHCARVTPCPLDRRLLLRFEPKRVPAEMNCHFDSPPENLAWISQIIWEELVWELRKVYVNFWVYRYRSSYECNDAHRVNGQLYSKISVYTLDRMVRACWIEKIVRSNMACMSMKMLIQWP